MKDKRPILITLLFCFLLAGTLSWSTASNTGQPIAVLPETKYEFNPVPEGSLILHGVKVRNKGTAPLIIESIKTG